MDSSNKVTHQWKPSDVVGIKKLSLNTQKKDNTKIDLVITFLCHGDEKAEPFIETTIKFEEVTNVTLTLDNIGSYQIQNLIVKEVSVKEIDKGMKFLVSSEQRDTFSFYCSDIEFLRLFPEAKIDKK